MATLVKRNGIYYAHFHDVSRVPDRKRLSLKTKNRTAANRLLSGIPPVEWLSRNCGAAMPRVEHVGVEDRTSLGRTSGA